MSIPIIISDRNTKNCSCSKSPKNNLIAVQLKISKEQDKTPHISSQVKIVHLNIRSLKNKTHFIEITNFIKLNNVDVLTLSETWLNTTTKNYEIAIEGYKLFRLDRLRKKGGGVCAYIRHNIKASVIKDLSFISDSSFHQFWIQLQYNKNKSVVICIVYRVPDCPVDRFDSLLKPNYTRALLKQKPIIILGDFNCNMMNKDSTHCKALQTFIIESNLTQVIEDHTRVTNKSASLLDVIMTSSPSLIKSSGVLSTCISDHLPVYAIVRMKVPKPQQSFKTIRSFKRYNPMEFRLDLSRQYNTLDLIHELEDINDKVLIF